MSSRRGATPAICAVEGETTIVSIVPDGTKVAQGQVVCELDTSTLKKAIEKQEIAVRQAEANHWNATLTRQVAEVSVAEYEAAIKGGGRKIRKEDLREQERIDHNGLKELRDRVEESRADELAKQAASKLEKAKLEQLKRQLASCAVHAPIAGTLFHDNRPGAAGLPQIAKGKTVRHRERIFSIHDLDDPMRVSIELSEPVAHQVRIGTLADITVFALDGVKMVGHVDSVAQTFDPRRPFGRNSTRKYSATVAISDAPPALRPGMLAQAEILIDHLDGVLAVPVQAIVRYDGKDHLAVKKPDGSFDWREVTLGLASDQLVEVKQGVQTGDLVALKPLAVLRDGRLNDPPTEPAKPTP